MQVECTAAALGGAEAVDETAGRMSSMLQLSSPVCLETPLCHPGAMHAAWQLESEDMQEGATGNCCAAFWDHYLPTRTEVCTSGRSI